MSRPMMVPVLLLAALVSGCTRPAPVPDTTSPPPGIAAQVPADWRFPLQAAPAVSAAGMITSDDTISARVGMAILKQGGNAVDAAVATAFALAVAYPEAGNIGGGGFIVLRMAEGEVAALDFREKAPAAASADMFLDAQGEPTDASITGHLASGVPGAVAGLHEAHSRFGSLPWRDVVAPAIALAENGFIVNSRLTRTVRADSARMARFPGSSALLLPNGRPVVTGTTWRNPDLAAVLRRIAERGRDGFYRGETADLIVAEMRAGGGLTTHADLENYTAEWREPVVSRYRGHTVLSMPPASSGGLTLALALNIMEGFDLRAMGWHSPQMLHVTAEAMRRAFADRNHYLGDPDFVDVEREQFLSKEYADRLRATISLDRATPSSAVGVTAKGPEPDQTTHISVVDKAGNAVALTTTINELYGSGVVVRGAGFFLNDEMDDFTSKPGSPNMYGLVQGKANAIEPGKRMLSAMTPTILLDPEGRPLLVTGARGGPRIISAVIQVISNVVDYGMDVSTALNVPRIHHQHLPDVLWYETGGLTAAQTTALQQLGHELRTRSGVGTAPSILRRDGVWRGRHDPRDGGFEIGQ